MRRPCWIIDRSFRLLLLRLHEMVLRCERRDSLHWFHVLDGQLRRSRAVRETVPKHRRSWLLPAIGERRRQVQRGACQHSSTIAASATSERRRILRQHRFNNFDDDRRGLAVLDDDGREEEMNDWLHNFATGANAIFILLVLGLCAWLLMR